MGMAASQARYLALTARKTNTEWEGQQINQARTALANQSANLFNRLLNMEVPNAPKTTDYTELQYSYSDGDSNSVIEEWHQLSDKNSEYNYVVKHYYFADIFTGAKKMLSDPQVQVGDVLKEIKYNPETANISYGSDGVTVTYKIGDEDKSINYQKLTDAQIAANAELKKAFEDFANAKNLAKQDGIPLTDDVYGYYDSATGTWHFFIANIQEEDYTHITQEMVDGDDTLKEYLMSNNLLDDEGNLVPDCKFELKSRDGDYYYETGVTDENGIYVFENVPYGEYTYTELEAPEEYLIDTTPHDITINTEETTIVVKDLRAPIIDVDTSDIAVVGIAVVMIASVFGIVFIVRKKTVSNR